MDDQRKFLGLFANGDESSPAQIECQLEDIAKQVSEKKVLILESF